MKKRIPYVKPSITALEEQHVQDAMANGWGENCYEYIDRFENSFREHLQVKHTVSTSSCTGALHMGMAAMGIGPGDEVILADTNWIATVSPIIYLGARPIFVDILADSWCLDPEKVEFAITKNTRAIIATHIYGNLCELTRLQSIADKYAIPIIEDAAEAIGSVYFGRRAGTIGKFGVFSFHGSKTITTGEGGMFVTNDTNLYERFLTLSNHGRKPGETKQFWPELIGFKYKLSNIQAAMGCAQIQRIKELVQKKRDILQFYRLQLEDRHHVRMNPEPGGCVNGAWMPTAVFSKETGITREKLQKAFSEENIDARVFFWPLSMLPMFRGPTSTPVSYALCKRAINLPSYHDMTLEDQVRVISVIRGLLNE